MEERALRAGLLLLSTALSLGPFLAAFASQGWNLRSALVENLGPWEDLASGGKEPTVESGDHAFLGSPTRENDLPPLVIHLSLTNPYSFRLVVEETPLRIFCSEDNLEVGEGRLERTVVGPASKENLRILLTFTREGSRHLLEKHLVDAYLWVSLNLKGNFRLDVYGLKIEVPIEQRLELCEEVGG